MNTRQRQGDRPKPRVEYRGTGFYASLGVVFVAAVLLLILAVQNTQPVNVAFFTFEVEMPLFAVAIGAGLVTLVLDEFIGAVWRARRRRRLAQERELDRLRSGADQQ